MYQTTTTAIHSFMYHLNHKQTNNKRNEEYTHNQTQSIQGQSIDNNNSIQQTTDHNQHSRCLCLVTLISSSSCAVPPTNIAVIIVVVYGASGSDG